MLKALQEEGGVFCNHIYFKVRSLSYGRGKLQRGMNGVIRMELPSSSDIDASNTKYYEGACLARDAQMIIPMIDFEGSRHEMKGPRRRTSFMKMGLWKNKQV